ncbi:MAG TPA: cyclase family protein [Thermomicrobiales bacterium]|nr:cyclase family protein [Thermomicrobiales bacterium]
MRLIDVSHIVEAGMITYKELPAPVVCDFLSRADSRAHYALGTEFVINTIELVGNTGTYVDSPFHRFADGVDLAGLPLAAVAALPGVVVRATARSDRAIGRDAFADVDVRGKAVLIHTGWDAHWRTDQYFEGHSFLAGAAAEALVAGGAAFVGIDSLNIDDIGDGARPVHTLLLGAGIPIGEHLCGLAALPNSGFRFFATPVKVRGCGAFPVRAFGLAE